MAFLGGALLHAACVCATTALTISSNSSYFLAPSAGTPGSALTAGVKDLVRDLYKVVGVPVAPLLSLPAPAVRTACDTVLVLAMDGSMPAESFTIAARPAPGPLAYATVTLTGADTRGLLYAIYHFTHAQLGVDPFWWFLDIQPPFQGVVTVPDDYAYASGAPAFLSRGAFFNDEDLSGYFFADAAGDSVYTGHVANFYCETLLRLRANTIIPSTFAFVDERPYRVAAARGLKLGNHHVMPVGNNVYAWPKGVPYSFRTSPEPFVFAWESVIDYQLRQEQREMVFSVGYRGINDEPFWNQVRPLRAAFFSLPWHRACLRVCLPAHPPPHPAGPRVQHDRVPGRHHLCRDRKRDGHCQGYCCPERTA